VPEPRPHIFDLTPDTLRDLVVQWGMPAFRAAQVLEWVYRHNIIDPRQMTNLAADDRDTLAERLAWLRGDIIAHHAATDGTQKLLIDWGRGEATDQTECVMIPSPAPGSGTPGNVGGGQRTADNESEPNGDLTAPPPTRPRRTACISSQVGCPVGCTFCASGLGGLDGNLTAGQIIEQVWQLQQFPDVERITNVVFMGMGEPLANFDAVTRAVRTLNTAWGMNIGGRRITISTVGLPAPIRRLADLELPVTLAISLHAPNDTLRRRIIPWAQFVSIEQLLEAGRYYFRRTGREITLEYILLGAFNDQPGHARELAAVARTLRSNVNLIRYNEVAGLPYRRPADADVHTFQQVLRQAGVNAHIRASRGRDIAAACGQLRHEHAQAT